MWYFLRKGMHTQKLVKVWHILATAKITLAYCFGPNFIGNCWSHYVTVGQINKYHVVSYQKQQLYSRTYSAHFLLLGSWTYSVLLITCAWRSESYSLIPILLYSYTPPIRPIFEADKRRTNKISQGCFSTHPNYPLIMQSVI